jgi:hypothetical protein
MKHPLILLTSLLLPLLVPAQPSGSIIWTDSLALTGVPLRGSDLSAGVILNAQAISTYGASGLRTSIDLTQISPQANARTATRAGEVYYVLDYPDQILKIDFQTGRHEKLRLVTRLKGRDYDMFTPTVNAAAYIPELNALAYYVLPLGTEAKNMFTDAGVYQDAGLVGIFSIRDKKVVLTDVIGTRDPVYVQRPLLPHLHHAYLGEDTASQVLYAGQSATPEIQQLSLSGEVLARFGQRGRHVVSDTIVPIPPGMYTPRRDMGYGMLATHYQYLYVDALHKRLYRTYRIGERISLQEDSLAIDLPKPSSDTVCAYDRYLDFMIPQWNKLTRGLQVYDLTQSPPVLLMDLPIQQRHEVLATPSDRELIVYSPFRDGKYWLYRGVIAPEGQAPWGR